MLLSNKLPGTARRVLFGAGHVITPVQLGVCKTGERFPRRSRVDPEVFVSGQLSPANNLGVFDDELQLLPKSVLALCCRLRNMGT